MHPLQQCRAGRMHWIMFSTRLYPSPIEQISYCSTSHSTVDLRYSATPTTARILLPGNLVLLSLSILYLHTTPSVLETCRLCKSENYLSTSHDLFTDTLLSARNTLSFISFTTFIYITNE